MVEEYTRFEKARLVGARALQISEGAPPLLETEETRPLHIAKKELEEGIIPIGIKIKEKGY